MGFLRFSEPYNAKKAQHAKLQPKIHPLPKLRRPWFKGGKIVCEEGWSVSYSSSCSSRIDRYDYYEDGRHLGLSGEGVPEQMDIFVDSDIYWDEPERVKLDEPNRQRVLQNITAALQWAGFDVGFFPG
jgi:hypothetical protein